MEDHSLYWTALNIALSGKRRILPKLKAQFSSVTEIFQAGRSGLIALGVEEAVAAALSSGSLLRKAEREIDRLHEKGYTILTLDSPEYPDLLREIYDPPVVLNCAGGIEALQNPAVAVVGSRKPSPYGRAVAEKISGDLASRGLVVVSGMARGIDTIAHWGALKEGKTVAVLGSGLECIYPAENRRLFDAIRDNGVVVSEFPSDSPPLGFHFPLRNRIIAGLSMAVTIVEAAARSGSLITARLALEFNREVTAVPGNITSELSRGPNWLIRHGAKPVAEWRDIVEELPSPIKERYLRESDRPVSPELQPNKEEKLLLEHIPVDDAVQIDELIEKLDLSAAEILALLLQLEIKNLILPLPGKYYQRKM